jgi:tetratricopeptide (TPR) repeat protein
MLLRRAAAYLLMSVFYFPSSCAAQAPPAAWREAMAAGKTAFEEKRYADAETHFLNALRLAESFAPSDTNLLLTLNNVATVFAVERRSDELENVFAGFLAQRENPSGGVVAANLTLAVGRACRLVREFRLAEKFLKRALAAHEKASGKVHLSVAVTLDELALLNLSWLREVGAQSPNARYVPAPYGPSQAKSSTAIPRPQTTQVPDPQPARSQLLNDNAGAEKLARRALEIREKLLGPEHIDLVPGLTAMLAIAAMRQSHHNPPKLADTLAYYNRALNIVEKNRALPNPFWAEAIATHAAYHQSHGRFGPAEDLYRLSLRIFEKVYGPIAPQLAAPLREFATLLRETNRPLDAAELEARASALSAKKP